MAPEIVEAFVAEFHAEVNRLRSSGVAQQTGKEKELAAIRRKLDGLYDAIADGLRTEGLKGKLEDLEQRKTVLEVELATPAPNPPLLHPNLAKLYAKRVANLHEALRDEGVQTEALDILRGLIERVEIGPKAEDGTRSVELIGDIAAMIESACQGPNSKAPAGRAGVLGIYAGSAKVVAGAGFEPATFRL